MARKNAQGAVNGSASPPQQRVDLQDITATLVDLAVRGYVKISIETREALFGLLDSEEILR